LAKKRTSLILLLVFLLAVGIVVFIALTPIKKNPLVTGDNQSPLQTSAPAGSTSPSPSSSTSPNNQSTAATNSNTDSTSDPTASPQYLDPAPEFPFGTLLVVVTIALAMTVSVKFKAQNKKN